MDEQLRAEFHSLWSEIYKSQYEDKNDTVTEFPRSIMKSFLLRLWQRLRVIFHLMATMTPGQRLHCVNINVPHTPEKLTPGTAFYSESEILGKNLEQLHQNWNVTVATSHWFRKCIFIYCLIKWILTRHLQYIRTMFDFFDKRKDEKENGNNNSELF